MIVSRSYQKKLILRDDIAQLMAKLPEETQSKWTAITTGRLQVGLVIGGILWFFDGNFGLEHLVLRGTTKMA